eukprot:GHVP01062821.1.p1 GENE.GHVP01062821.1~~GHVP01062821.1.p1  ORF type:complete len:325 (-),score=49.50 GHVP01062821.1:84-1058(-)
MAKAPAIVYYPRTQPTSLENLVFFMGVTTNLELLIVGKEICTSRRNLFARFFFTIVSPLKMRIVWLLIYQKLVAGLALNAGMNPSSLNLALDKRALNAELDKDKDKDIEKLPVCVQELIGQNALKDSSKLEFLNMCYGELKGSKPTELPKDGMKFTASIVKKTNDAKDGKAVRAMFYVPGVILDIDNVTQVALGNTKLNAKINLKLPETSRLEASVLQKEDEAIQIVSKDSNKQYIKNWKKPNYLLAFVLNDDGGVDSVALVSRPAKWKFEQSFGKDKKDVDEKEGTLPKDVPMCVIWLDDEHKPSKFEIQEYENYDVQTPAAV